MKSKILFFGILFLFISNKNVCYAATDHIKTGHILQPSAKSKYSYKIIPAASNTWGYDIYADGSLLIHQPSRPGLPGNIGFNTTEKAIKVAKLIIERIKAGHMPPTVTIDEMNKLKVL